MVSIISICAYANTCTYDGIQVTLSERTVTVGSGTGYAQDYAVVNFTTDKPANSPRVLLQFRKNGTVVKEVWVNLNSSSGAYNWYAKVSMPEGTYEVSLVQRPGMCY
ncbi:MAG: hypothetical protein UH625_08080 [Muribaculaceae bacterium]|nr:hypothetical protein [Muribaculaceae bacterium]